MLDMINVMLLFSIQLAPSSSSGARPHPIFDVAVDDVVQFFIGETIAELAMPHTGSTHKVSPRKSGPTLLWIIP
jgi:hypothetical protein